jgi:hypothetical protein
MSKTDSLHYKLCCEGAKWLHKNMIQERDGSWVGTCKIVAVELVTAGALIAAEIDRFQRLLENKRK